MPKNNIGMLRRERKMTIEELALKIGVGRDTMSHYEDGITFMTTDKLELLADVFDVSTDYILGRTNQRFVDVKRVMEVVEEAHMKIAKELYFNTDK